MLRISLWSVRIKRTDASKLQDEYQKLVQGLQEQDVARDEDQWLSNPILPEDILKEAIPGNIRRAEHFTAFLARFVEYLKVGAFNEVCIPSVLCISLNCNCTSQTRMRVLHVVAETPASFLQHLKELTFIEKKPLRYAFDQSFFSFVLRCLSQTDHEHFYLRFCAERLSSLVRTLEMKRLDEISSLQKVATFATLVATYDKGDFHTKSHWITTLLLKICLHFPSTGFLLILEPFESDMATVPNPIFHLT